LQLCISKIDISLLLKVSEPCVSCQVICYSRKLIYT
jgi:hypothetical protein